MASAYFACRETLFQTVKGLAREFRDQTGLDSRRMWSSKQAEADGIFMSCVRAIEWDATLEEDAHALLVALEALRQARLSQANAGSVAEYNDLIKVEDRQTQLASDIQNELRSNLDLPPLRPFWRAAGNPPGAFPAE